MDTLVSPRRRRLLAALGAASLLGGCSRMGTTGNRRNALTFGGATMGTSWTATLAGTHPGRLADAARDAISAALERVVLLMSAYDPDSQLSRFNRHAEASPFPVAPEMLEVFAIARSVSQDTAGAFDTTVAPAVQAWGFGAARNRQVPRHETLAALSPLVDWRHLRIDTGAGTITKARGDVRADLDGIAPGYAVDLAALALDRLGIEDYLLELGGEVRTRGANPDRQAWRIGIERPDAPGQHAWRVVPLSGLAMSTSGDYRSYFEEGGQRYSHEIDPQTRSPVKSQLASVSVIADSCARADSLATALFVLGPERGYALAQTGGHAAHFILREPAGKLAGRSTPAFAALEARRGQG